MANKRKDWSPGVDRPRVIKNTLKKIAPSIAFVVKWIPDNNFVWDGDGPDPADEGYMAYDVDVSAMAVINGERLWGVNSLGGVYTKPDEQDPDIGGYLIQMLDEALADLQLKKLSATLRAETRAARKLLDEEAESRYQRSLKRDRPVIRY